MQIEVDGERLLLTIDRVVDSDEWCPHCHEGVVESTTNALIRCDKCHGTGKRKVRVTGYVEVVVWGNDNDSNWYIGEGDLKTDRSGEGTWPNDAIEDYIAAVVTAYLAGTLPDAIAANLKRENVDN